MLSFSNFGSTKHPQYDKMRRARELLKMHEPIPERRWGDDGRHRRLARAVAPGISLLHPEGPANVLIFPDLNGANIAYKRLMKVGDAEAIGPILMGMSKPVYVQPRGAEVEDIVNVTAIAVVEAQSKLSPSPRMRPQELAVTAD